MEPGSQSTTTHANQCVLRPLGALFNIGLLENRQPATEISARQGIRAIPFT